MPRTVFTKRTYADKLSKLESSLNNQWNFDSISEIEKLDSETAIAYGKWLQLKSLISDLKI